MVRAAAQSLYFSHPAHSIRTPRTVAPRPVPHTHDGGHLDQPPSIHPKWACTCLLSFPRFSFPTPVAHEAPSVPHHLRPPSLRRCPSLASQSHQKPIARLRRTLHLASHPLPAYFSPNRLPRPRGALVHRSSCNGLPDTRSSRCRRTAAAPTLKNCCWQAFIRCRICCRSSVSRVDEVL